MKRPPGWKQRRAARRKEYMLLKRAHRRMLADWNKSRVNFIDAIFRLPRDMQMAIQRRLWMDAMKRCAHLDLKAGALPFSADLMPSVIAGKGEKP